MQVDIGSQLQDLLNESQIDVVIEDDEDDEGSIEKQMREATQRVLQGQQDLMAARAHADKARQAEAEASEAWQAKRYCTTEHRSGNPKGRYTIFS